MAIIKASAGRVQKESYLEEIKLFRSGVKLTPAIARKMGFAPKDNLNYAFDRDAGKLYFVKDSAGTKLSDKFLTNSTGMRMELVALATDKDLLGFANGDEVVNAGGQLIFGVVDSPVEQDGDQYWEVVFKRAVAPRKASEQNDEIVEKDDEIVENDKPGRKKKVMEAAEVED